MLKSFRKFAVLLLLLVIPLQGVAASLTDALCSPAPASTQHIDTHSHDGSVGAAHEHDGSVGEDHATHLCCHHFFTAIPTVIADVDGAAPSAVDSPHPHPLRLFFPEQPLRVPVA
ncbi:MAG: hypothetical protein OEZ08_18535 [Betaproteobacteria bacterium]|nr:hypothetical protein [Betaproteobacteria bacterium]